MVKMEQKPAAKPATVVTDEHCEDITGAMEAVQEKMNWAAAELTGCSSISGSSDLIGLIKNCSETLLSLKQHL